MSLSQKAKIVLACLAIPLVMCGCFNKTGNEQEENDNRMTLIYNSGFAVIYRDNETGVQYFSRADSGTCVMVNADGTPYTGTPKGGDTE